MCPHFIGSDREEWEWLHQNASTSSLESSTPISERHFDENGLPLFKIQFQDAAKDLCLMLSESRPHGRVRERRNDASI